jgi:hypothetical protein
MLYTVPLGNCNELLIVIGLVAVPATAGAVNVAVPLVEPAKDRMPLLVPDNPTVNVAPEKVSCVLVFGAAPAPPPNTTEVEASNADVAQVDALEKYTMPPEVPATVRAGVLVGVATEINPPVKDTLVTPPVVFRLPLAS